MHLVIRDAEIVVSVSMFTIGTDGALETLSGFFVALHLELADPDLVEHGRVARRASHGGLVVVHCVDIVLILAQFVATSFEFLGRCSGSGWVDAVLRRRADYQLFCVLSLRWENEKSSEEKQHRADADPGKHIHPRPNVTNLQTFIAFSVWRYVPCKFETTEPGFLY
jgi:hypothetical protein